VSIRINGLLQEISKIEQDPLILKDNYSL